MSLGSPTRPWLPPPDRTSIDSTTQRQGDKSFYAPLAPDGSGWRHSRWSRLGGKGSTLFALGLGQTLSILIAGTAITSSLLAQRNISIPTTQSFLNYLLLTSYLFFRARRPLQVAWWRYALQAVVDVEANYLVVLAYRYTSITSITLLDCFAIPCAMLLSYCFLHARYGVLRMVGVFVCLLGLGLTVLSDSIMTKGDNGRGQQLYPHALLGDLYCILGASLYATSNVMQEAVVKAHDPVEFLGMLGAMGSVLSFIQAAALEGEQIRRASWDTTALMLLVGFAAFLFAMYSLTALFLTKADATIFNLSLLTSDVYAVLYRWRFQRSRVTWVYLLAFCCTLLGLCLYQRPGPVTNNGDRGGGAADTTTTELEALAAEGEGGEQGGSLGGGLEDEEGGRI